MVHVLHCVTAALVDLLKDGGTMIVYQNPWKSLKKTQQILCLEINDNHLIDCFEC